MWKFWTNLRHLPVADRRPLATLEEVAAFLQVPVKTLYAWRYRGEGPCGHRVGRYVRFRWEEVEAWIDASADDLPTLGRRKRQLIANEQGECA
jgi:excisionase family DNA binding protein